MPVSSAVKYPLAFASGDPTVQRAPRLLVVDDEAVILEILREFLEYEGMQVVCAESAEAAIGQLKHEPFDVVLTDLKMPGLGGLHLLRHVRESHADTQCVIMTGFGTVETAIEAMKQGAFDYILKPFRPDEVIQVVRRVLEKQQLERENIALRELVGFYELSEALSSAMPLDDQLGLIVAMVRDNLGADGVSLVIEDPKQPGTYLTRTDCGLAQFVPNLLRMSDSFSSGQKVLAHGDDVHHWLKSPSRAEGEVVSFMAAPLKVRGHLFGVLNAYSLRRGHKFSEGQRKGLAVFGGRAADAIEAARMYSDLQTTFTQTIEGLARALEAKDTYTHGHSDRVALYAKLLAEAMGLSPKDVERIKHGGLMHDIGKMGIRSVDLNKPRKLSAAEYHVFKSHPVQGRRIIEPIKFLAHLVPCVYHHHESWDGTGYPEGLEGHGIPVDARILSVVDSYDAMTSNRPYRKALPHDIALTELKRCTGKQFDPDAVEAFLGCIADHRRHRRIQGLPVPE